MTPPRAGAVDACGPRVRHSSEALCQKCAADMPFCPFCPFVESVTYKLSRGPERLNPSMSTNPFDKLALAALAISEPCPHRRTYELVFVERIGPRAPPDRGLLLRRCSRREAHGRDSSHNRSRPSGLLRAGPRTGFLWSVLDWRPGSRGYPCCTSQCVRGSGPIKVPVRRETIGPTLWWGKP